MSVSELLSEQRTADRERGTRTVDLADDGAVLETLATDTARRVLGALHHKPGTPSEVASRTDISLQNAIYHLDRLQDTGLIETVGTRYSSKARPMDVYAPTDRRLVVQYSDDE